MNNQRRGGFTIIELMVALVVAGLLMAVLVGIAGSVQNTFGRTKGITELQANLRFAMRNLVEDFHRVAYMFPPDPARDPRRYGPLPSSMGLDVKSIVYAGTGNDLILRGNFVSSRDYRIAFNLDNSVQVLCRNGMEFSTDPSTSMPSCGFAGDAGGYEPYLEPFADGPKLAELFCPGEYVRMDVGSRAYVYLTVGGIAGDLGVSFSEAIDRDRIKGAGRSSESQFTDMHAIWLSPVTTVRYRLQNGGTPPPYGSFGTVRWVLEREADDCRKLLAESPTEPTVLADFMLPPDEAQAPGLALRTYVDSAWGTGQPGPWQPTIDMVNPANSVDVIPGGGGLDWSQARAVSITLRGRTETEDPNLKLTGYPSADAKNFGFDLDQNPDNGLAHVRVEQIVIQLQNMALAPNPGLTN